MIISYYSMSGMNKTKLKAISQLKGNLQNFDNSLFLSFFTWHDVIFSWNRKGLKEQRKEFRIRE